MLCQLLRRRFFSSSTASTAPRGRITAREGCILIDNGAKRNAMTLDMYRDVPGAVAAHLRGVQLSTRRVCLLAGQSIFAILPRIDDRRNIAHSTEGWCRKNYCTRIR